MKTGYFITARLKSSRLTRKIVLPLHGQSILDHVVDRCKLVENIDDVVLCTSTNTQDAELYDYALKHRIKFFAGSEDDVLSRLSDAATYYGIDSFLSITADNPLHSVEVGSEMVSWAKREDFDFIFVSGLPIGTMPYYINSKALQIAISMKKKADTEIWGPFVNRPDFFKIGYLNVETDIFNNDTRLTCDYKEDYEFLNSVYNSFPAGHPPTLSEVANSIKDNKLQLINSSAQQTIVPESVLDDIKNTFNDSITLGSEVALKVGRKLLPGSHTATLTL